MKHIFFSILSFLIIASCSEDDFICDNSDCIIEISCPRDGYINVADSIYNNWGTQYNNVHASQSSFSINPNNSDELAFCKLAHDNLSTTFQLLTYNRITKQENLIYEGYAGPYGSTPPRWSSDNWIYFDIGNNIFKTKHNGSELTQITFGDSNKFFGDISSDNKHIIYYDDSLFSLVNLDLINNNSIIISTNEEATRSISFAPNDYEIAFMQAKATGNFKLVRYNLTTKERTVFFETKSSSIFSTCWSNDNKYIYWSDNTGLYKLNISNQKVEKIAKHFGSGLKYIYPYIDNNGTLYLTKETAWKSGGNEISIKGEIIEYDLNTCTEIKIFD
jgi:Tol biopolymer transport system component